MKNLPIQAAAVQRTRSISAMAAGVAPSGIACTLCQMACDQLSGLAKTACQIACNNTVC